MFEVADFSDRLRPDLAWRGREWTILWMDEAMRVREVELRLLGVACDASGNLDWDAGREQAYLPLFGLLSTSYANPTFGDPLVVHVSVSTYLWIWPEGPRGGVVLQGQGSISVEYPPGHEVSLGTLTVMPTCEASLERSLTSSLARGVTGQEVLWMASGEPVLDDAEIEGECGED